LTALHKIKVYSLLLLSLVVNMSERTIKQRLVHFSHSSEPSREEEEEEEERRCSSKAKTDSFKDDANAKRTRFLSSINDLARRTGRDNETETEHEVNKNEQDHAFVILIAVSVIACATTCWFLEKYAYLLRPLVAAFGIALCLQPIVDFLADKAYQAKILRKWRLKREVSGDCLVHRSMNAARNGAAVNGDEEDDDDDSRRRSLQSEEDFLEYERERRLSGCVLVVPRPVAICVAIFFVVLLLFTFLFALYLGQTWIVSHLHDDAWDDRFKERIQILANFLDNVAKKIFQKDDVAVDAWQTIVDRVESWLRDEDFWTSLGQTLFRYFGDVCLTSVYSMFLLVPERQPLRFKKPVVKRTVVAVRKFMNIMIVLAFFRATLVSFVLYVCGVPLILAASLAIASFWLYFIPTLGSLISFALPVPIALLLPDLKSSARWCACILPSFASAIVGDFVGPVAYRKGLDLSEVTVLLCLVFWYSVWGAAGAILAVPLTCAIKIGLEEMPHAGAKMVARVMAPRLRRRQSKNVQTNVNNNTSNNNRAAEREGEIISGDDTNDDDDDAEYERAVPRTPYTVRAARWTWRKVTKPSASNNDERPQNASGGYRRLVSEADEENENQRRENV